MVLAHHVPQGILKFKIDKLGAKLGSLCVKDGKAATLRIGDHVRAGSVERGGSRQKRTLPQREIGVPFLKR